MRKFNVTVNGKKYEVEVEEENSSAQEVVPSAPKKSATPEDADIVRAPMPGTVLKVNVKQGDHIEKGDVLIVLEAMKMENDIKAAHGGTIGEVFTSVNASVESNSPLVSII